MIKSRAVPVTKFTSIYIYIYIYIYIDLLIYKFLSKYLFMPDAKVCMGVLM